MKGRKEGRFEKRTEKTFEKKRIEKREAKETRRNPRGETRRKLKETKETKQPVMRPPFTFTYSSPPRGSLRIAALDLRIRGNTILAVPYTPDIRSIPYTAPNKLLLSLGYYSRGVGRKRKREREKERDKLIEGREKKVVSWGGGKSIWYAG